MCNEQKKPHKHAELIKAWADGAEIQYEKGKGTWIDMDYHSLAWHPECKYRIKPKEPVVRYARLNKSQESTSHLGKFTYVHLHECLVEDWDNVKATFDPDTGKLISVEKI